MRKSAVFGQRRTIVKHEILCLFFTRTPTIIASSLRRTVSCPGKVLLVGGYMVLQEGSHGLVVSTSSRFYTTFEWVSSSGEPNRNKCGIRIRVVSPQFGAEWDYILPESAPYVPIPTDADRRNLYVEYALALALAAATAGDPDILGRDPVSAAISARNGAQSAHLLLSLRADNDFYSQRAHLIARGQTVTRAHLAALPRFIPCPTDPVTGRAIVSKTGLGSSAALVTSVVAAVLALLGGVELPWDVAACNRESTATCGLTPTTANKAAAAGQLVVHNVAQVAHGLAQGKIGSGFDVCAAALGSMRFSRVPSATLGAAMATADSVLRDVTSGIASGVSKGESPFIGRYRRLSSLLRHGLAAASAREGREGSVDNHADDGLVDAVTDVPTSLPGWSFTAEPFSLPRGLALVLADVVGGSETPSMVRSVLLWRDAGSNSIGSDSNLVSEDEAILVSDVSDREQSEAMLAAARKAHGPRVWQQLAAANARVDVAVRQLRSLYESTDLNSHSVGDHAVHVKRPSSAETERVSPQCKPLPVALYDEALVKCARVLHTEWRGLETACGNDSALGAVAKALADIADAFGNARALLRHVGELARVPIEPPEQTSLADATLAVPGVVAAGVPGAGGYDAMFAVVIELDTDASHSAALRLNEAAATVRSAVSDVWLHWPGGGLTPLLLRDGPAVRSAGAGVLRHAAVPS